MWKDLSIAQRSQLMNLMRHNGITSLSEMRRIYDNSSPSLFPLAENTSSMKSAPVYENGGHKFGPGGGKSIPLSTWIRAGVNKFLSTDKAKELAFKIGAYDHQGYGMGVKDVVEALASKQKPYYDELQEYIYPGSMEYKPYEGQSKGPLTQDKYKNVRQFESTVRDGNYINARGEYLIPEEYKGLFEELAKQGALVYSNADWETDHPERFDAANYPIRFRLDENGNIVADAADLYDFDRGYSGRYNRDSKVVQSILRAESDLMSKVGEPYIMRQDNIPVRFIDSKDEDSYAGESFIDAITVGETGKPYLEETMLRQLLSKLPYETLDAATVEAEMPSYLRSNGGHKIHIKKENRGKFTALKKRTGKSASWFKAHGTPAQKKMAIFALNAKKWKHSHGGIKF